MGKRGEGGKGKGKGRGREGKEEEELRMELRVDTENRGESQNCGGCELKSRVGRRPISRSAERGRRFDYCERGAPPPRLSVRNDHTRRPQSDRGGHRAVDLAKNFKKF